MEFRQLEHFVAVAEERNFHQAAARCHIVPSGLSASVRALEQELGSRLFHRTTRHVELTEAGWALLPAAHRTLAAAAEARSVVSDVEHLLTGTLSIGITRSHPAVDLPRLVARFHREHPHVVITVVQAPPVPTIERVSLGTLDVAFSDLPASPPVGVHSEPVGSGPMVLACSPQCPLADSTGLTVEALRDQTFIDLTRGWFTRLAVDAAFLDHGIAHRDTLEVSEIGTLLDLVGAGTGVAIVPGPDAGGPFSRLHRKGEVAGTEPGALHPDVCYVPLTAAGLAWSFGSVVLSRAPASPSARAFLAIAHPARPAITTCAGGPESAAGDASEMGLCHASERGGLG